METKDHSRRLTCTPAGYETFRRLEQIAQDAADRRREAALEAGHYVDLYDSFPTWCDRMHSIVLDRQVRRDLTPDEMDYLDSWLDGYAVWRQMDITIDLNRCEAALGRDAMWRRLAMRIGLWDGYGLCRATRRWPLAYRLALVFSDWVERLVAPLHNWGYSGSHEECADALNLAFGQSWDEWPHYNHRQQAFIARNLLPPRRALPAPQEVTR